MNAFEQMSPREIVAELDKYIVGQQKAKKAVAVALRNRVRRLKLPLEIRDEVAPKNILMMGPTGVGKTEIARRIAKLAGSPFLKVEATKFTEVGYVGRDVESMVRDLMQSGFAMVKAEMSENLKSDASRRSEEAILDLLLPSIKTGQVPTVDVIVPQNSTTSETREKFRKMLHEGKLDDRMVEINVNTQTNPAIEIFSGANMEDLEASFGNLSNMFGNKKKKKSVTVKEAKEYLLQEELEKLVDRERVAEEARNRVEQSGIIFLDEIDKIANRDGKAGGMDVSREGVQRDILPIVEGSTVSTKYGPVDTTHILFIAAGAFNVSKPQDLIPELQGRFPIRVELDSLDANDFVRILTEPKNALTKQYTELLRTENVEIVFTEESILRLAEIAQDVNSKTENIGARRLHTVLERLLEELSFEANERSGETITITPAYVDERFEGVFEKQDLIKYIL